LIDWCACRLVDSRLEILRKGLHERNSVPLSEGGSDDVGLFVVAAHDLCLLSVPTLLECAEPRLGAVDLARPWPAHGQPIAREAPGAACFHATEQNVARARGCDSSGQFSRDGEP